VIISTRGKNDKFVENGKVQKMEEQILCPFPGLSAKSKVWSHSSTYPMSLLQLCIMAGFTAFPCSSQKLPSNGGECMFISTFTFHLSFHSMAVKLSFTIVFR